VCLPHESSEKCDHVLGVLEQNGEKILNSPVLDCSQVLPPFKHSPKNLSTAPENKGRVRIMNVLSSANPNSKISSNLLTKRKIDSGSSDDKRGDLPQHFHEHRN
jgi:hypothetical protein